MGLDIQAFERLRPGQEDKDWHLYQPEGVPDRSDGIAGWYASDGESFRFRAGSYSGYNRWRDWLCKTFLGVNANEAWSDPDRFAGRPFIELINYSDCEGFFGPVTSAKLAKDFADHAPAPDSGEYAAIYADWSKAFALAARGGGIVYLT